MIRFLIYKSLNDLSTSPNVPYTAALLLLRSSERRWFLQRHFSIHVSKQSLYDVLNVPSNASPKDIKAAFYRQSMKHHPDRNQGKDGAEERFRAITDAYQTLSNPESREQYDISLNIKVRKVVKTDASSLYNHRRTPMTGRTEMYNFDEFYRQHYSQNIRKATFDKKMATILEMEERERQELKGQSKIVMFFGAILLLLGALDYSEILNQPPGNDENDKP